MSGFRVWEGAVEGIWWAGWRESGLWTIWRVIWAGGQIRLKNLPGMKYFSGPTENNEILGFSVKFRQKKFPCPGETHGQLERVKMVAPLDGSSVTP
jgi:hypothetical protein